LQCFLRCGVLQCVRMSCSVLQCVVVRCNVLPCVAMCCSVLQCVAVCCSVLQYVAVCCSVYRVLPYVAMCSSLGTSRALSNGCVRCNNTLLHTATLCNILQQSAAHCNTLLLVLHESTEIQSIFQRLRCRVLQCAAVSWCDLVHGITVFCTVL